MRLSVIMSMHTSEFLKKEIFPQKWKLFVQEQSKNLYLKILVNYAYDKKIIASGSRENTD
jgi:hypothetical protein